jgi:hypothetical protein
MPAKAHRHSATTVIRAAGHSMRQPFLKEQIASLRCNRSLHDIVGFPSRGGRTEERLALALFRSNEHDADLGVVTPDGLACSDGPAREYKIEHRRNAGRRLNSQAGASVGDIPNRARDNILSEKDLPGL